MSLKKVKTELTYMVPVGCYCNLNRPGTLNRPTKDLCRFCVKDGKGFRCALHNKTLDVRDTVLVLKTRDCEKALVGYRSVVEEIIIDEPTPAVDPKKLMKATIQLYDKTRKQLLSQGYPSAIADKIAQDFVLENQQEVCV